VKYTDGSKERVRDAVDMVDLVSTRTELRRAGARSFMGICPFHEERSPSLSVEPVEKLYHCFGCGASGDAFRFVMDTEGVDFRGALELLADRYGVELEVADEDPRAAERRRKQERLHELLERTAAFYVRYLWEAREAAAAREYLAGRGLTEATLREFRVGYAPSAWDKVIGASHRAGFGFRELYDAGLAQRGRGGGRLYDRFRSRITFPLCDARGRVLGFGARAMGEGRGPKYLNSPEGELFHKSRVLFGADLARAPAARAGAVVAVEGYTDVLALHQAGLRHTVGIMGTSLTEEQVRGLKRLAPVALLALDADDAGQEAMLRAQRVAAGLDLEIRVVPLPAGQDPADVVTASGAGEVERLVAESVPFARFRVQRALETGDLGDAEGKDRVLAALRPVFAELPASVLREELLRLVADRMDLREELVAGLLGLAGTGPGRPGARVAAPQAAPAGERSVLSRREDQERTFLAFCLANPEAGRAALAELDLEAELTSPEARRAAVVLRDHPDDPGAGVPEDDAPLAALVRELAVRAGRLPRSAAAFEVERLQLRLGRLEREVAAARRSGADLRGLAAEREAVRSRLDRAYTEAVEEALP
jgi:DNA primase